MKNTKTDHRSLYTRMMVNQALLKILAEKPLNKIGITELCLAANINRGTFYNHFYDVFDVYESLENGFFDEIKLKLEKIERHELSKSFFKEIILFIYENAALVNLIIKNKISSDFLQKIIEFAKEKFINAWSETSKVSKSLLEQIFSYNANGSIGIIADWVRSNMQQPLEQIADLISELNSLILKMYLK